jgi:hypothetical protein
VPAAVKTYRLRSDTGRPVKVVKAFLKSQARLAPDESVGRNKLA